ASSNLDLIAERDPAGLATRLAVPAAPCLARQARLTELLSRVEPAYEEVAPTEAAVVRRIEELLGRRVDLVSRGPRASDVGPWPAGGGGGISGPNRARFAPGTALRRRRQCSTAGSPSGAGRPYGRGAPGRRAGRRGAPPRGAPGPRGRGADAGVRR